MMSPMLLAADADLPEPVAGGWQLVLAAVAGIAVIVVTITWVKLHPFLALILGGATVGMVAGESIPTVLESFTKGFGSTAAGVGILIALGAMFAKLLADSGGADEIVDTIVGHASPRMLPWAMALVGAIIGLPMFFEIGLVLLMPVIYLVARRSGIGLIPIGIPALAGLSAMHGFVPPHPGPLVAIDALGADLGLTLALGVAVAIPTIIVAGPLFGTLAGKWVPLDAPHTFDADPADGPTSRRPGFGVTMATVLLPVVLMLGKAIAEIAISDDGNPIRQVLDVLGTPLIALLVAVIVAMVNFGRGSGMDRDTISTCVGSALPPIAGILLIVRVQTGPRRHRYRHPARRLGVGGEHLGDPARLGARRADPRGHRFGDRRNDHRVVADAGARRRPLVRSGVAGGARDRRRLGVPVARQRRRVLAGQGVLRDECRPDVQDVVGDGDDPVGDRADRGLGARGGDLRRRGGGACW
jgi:GntP family gluconate:H+ symporter